MQHIEFIIAVVILSFLTFVALRSPSHDRNWSRDQRVLPSVSSYGEFVTVHNVREARYRDVNDYDVSYRDWTFTHDAVVRTWVTIEPFGTWSIFGLRPAHMLVSFELADGRFLAVSPEIRKKEGDTFSPWKGFIRSYEIMYVVADELDVIELRATHRGDVTRVYPLTLTQEQSVKLFESMAKKINDIQTKAVFFNTAMHSCMTNIVAHLRAVGVRLPQQHILYLMPGTVDALFHKYKLLAIDAPLEKARQVLDVRTKAKKCTSSDNFSRCIRTT